MSKKERKALTLERRKNRIEHFDELHKAKELWEKARLKSLRAADREPMIAKIYGLIQGHLSEFVHRHDGSRVVQAVVKYGNGEQRDAILQELKGELVELSKSAYGKFLVLKMIKHGSRDNKDAIMKEFHGKLRLILKHAVAGDVVEFLYTDGTSNATGKGLMVQEFYGNEFLYFKDESIKGLADLLKLHPERKAGVIKHLGEYLNGIATKESMLNYNLVQRLLSEYLSHANEAECMEVCSEVQGALLHILHMRDGCKVAAHCLTYASGAKDRKVMLRQLKDKAVEVAQDPNGTLVLCRAMAVTDDTVLLHKSLVQALLAEAESIMDSPAGRKPLLYIICQGAHPRYFSPPEREIVEHQLASSSKKDPQIRAAELLSKSWGDLVKLCVRCTPQMLKSKYSSDILVEIIKRCPDPAAVSEIMEMVSDACLEQEEEIVKSPLCHHHVKRILKEGVETASGVDVPGIFQRRVSGRLATWCLSESVGAFLCAALLDADSTRDAVRQELMPHFKAIERHGKKPHAKGCAVVARLLQAPKK